MNQQRTDREAMFRAWGLPDDAVARLMHEMDAIDADHAETLRRTVEDYERSRQLFIQRAQEGQAENIRCFLAHSSTNWLDALTPDERTEYEAAMQKTALAQLVKFRAAMLGLFEPLVVAMLRVIQWAEGKRR